MESLGDIGDFLCIIPTREIAILSSYTVLALENVVKKKLHLDILIVELQNALNDNANNSALKSNFQFQYTLKFSIHNYFSYP